MKKRKSEIQRLLDEPKDSATIHYDEDTIPHGACSDPIHCDCMCPKCWVLKADIIRRAVVPPQETTTDALARTGKLGEGPAPQHAATDGEG